jgi:hypothetical protein
MQLPAIGSCYFPNTHKSTTRNIPVVLHQRRHGDSLDCMLITYVLVVRLLVVVVAHAALASACLLLDTLVSLLSTYYPSWGMF